MPRKIRELIRELERAGFVNRRGKGDHRNFEHSKGMRLTLSGNLVTMPTVSGTRSAQKDPGVKGVKDSAMYVKIVEWSDEDHCFVGQCPGIMVRAVMEMMRHKSMLNCVTLLKNGLPS
jgi:predicted RNA binding protein YcfA (HicA-like mRNA interferase family)